MGKWRFVPGSAGGAAGNAPRGSGVCQAPLRSRCAMSLPYLLSAIAGSIVLAGPPAGAAELPEPHDRCAYMNHDSKAYAFCMAEQAAARQSAKAASLPPPNPKPKPK